MRLIDIGKNWVLRSRKENLYCVVSKEEVPLEWSRVMDECLLWVIRADIIECTALENYPSTGLRMRCETGVFPKVVRNLY